MTDHVFFPHPSRRDVLLGSLVAIALWPLHPSLTFAQATGEGPDPESAARAREAVGRFAEVIRRISREVWENPELSLHEEVSSAIHIRELEAAGFAIISRGTSNIPTAFIAEWSQGENGPKVGFLPEHDALPALGNAAEPRLIPGPTGAEVGQGCGHNMLGAGCTGAAIALRSMMMEGDIPGTVRVYGCAAEETEGAKVYMARDGLFNDLDACRAGKRHRAPAHGPPRTCSVSGIPDARPTPASIPGKAAAPSREPSSSKWASS